ncbi:MAG: ABC transporter permease [Aerococcus sp.]|nr:ABC transporter permease [Aerococcus sp.]
MDFLTSLMPNVMESLDVIYQSTLETLYMTVITCIISFILGIVVGVLLTILMPGGLRPHPVIYSILDKLVNIFRSIPFVILIALLVTVTRLIVGTSIGTTAVIVPMVVGTIPFYARTVQNTLVEVDAGVIEAAEAMGLSTTQIIFRVLLKESVPGLIRISALTFVSVIGLSAMAGTVGGGGLGDLAITRGYQRHQQDITLVCTVIILIMVFIGQWAADKLAEHYEH